MIPEGQPKFNDLIDVIVQASQVITKVEQPDGTIINENMTDPETIWWKTGSVNSNTFARFALVLKEWERMGLEAFNNMAPERARLFAHQVAEIGLSYRRSVDAKSSESQRDKVNSQSTLIDKINRNKIEKVYTAKGEMKRSMLDGLLGRDRERDDETD